MSTACRAACFNSSVGILVVRTTVHQSMAHRRHRVSIPRSEFWSFGHSHRRCIVQLYARFQFLGRNSGRSDSLRAELAGCAAVVSIPRSEFWSFGLASRSGVTRSTLKFQFLGRNSGRSDIITEDLRVGGGLVSIPRSEFWSFGQGLIGDMSGREPNVSIPRSEFWSFGRVVGERHIRRDGRFNSSVGILVVRTHRRGQGHQDLSEFQFLGRNSGRSDGTKIVLHNQSLLSAKLTLLWRLILTDRQPILTGA